MKIYISADIEGITGVASWDDALKGKPDYEVFRKQMTREVAAACEGAMDAGATEIWVNDAHETGRNLIAGELPEIVQLIRGWSGHPMAMAQDLNENFDAAMMIGYHSGAGTHTNPLSHTMTSDVSTVSINGHPVSEFAIHALAAGMMEVPLVFLSGDAGICEDAVSLNPSITTVAVKSGIGASTLNIHPGLAVRRIREGVTAALNGKYRACIVPLPEWFEVSVKYVNHTKAYRAGFYPGAEKADAHTVTFESEDYLEVLRFFHFVF